MSDILQHYHFVVKHLDVIFKTNQMGPMQFNEQFSYELLVRLMQVYSSQYSHLTILLDISSALTKLYSR